MGRVLLALIDESLLETPMSHTVAAMSSGQPEEKKKHRGLGRLLGKRDKTPERPDHLPDSAYGSSEANSADGAVAGRSTPDMVSAEKNSEIANIDQDRNLALRPSTGEVLDEDTGEVVTVVTTTTTTTTTKGGNKHQDVQKDVKREIQHSPSRPPLLQEMPAGSSGYEPSQPAVTSTSTAQGGRAPAPVSAPTQASVPVSNGRLAADMPPVPAKSAMRKSGEMRRGVPGAMPMDDAPISPVDGHFAG